MNLRSGIAHPIMALVWRFALVLVAAGALFLAATVSLMKSPQVAGMSGPAKPASGDQIAGGAEAAPSMSFPAISEHPLFYPSRMPWVAQPPPQPAPVSTAPSPLTNYALVGVVVSGQTRSALIRPLGATKTITLAEGQALEGWTLQEITRTRLRFAAGDASYDMTFLKPSESAR